MLITFAHFHKWFFKVKQPLYEIVKVIKIICRQRNRLAHKVGIHSKGFYYKVNKDPRPITTRSSVNGQGITYVFISIYINVFVLPLVLLLSIKFLNSIKDTKHSMQPGGEITSYSL